MYATLARWLGRSPKPARRPVRMTLELVKLEDRTTPVLLAGVAHLNTLTALDQYDVASASNPGGARVAVWTHDVSASNTDIHGQRYSRLGVKIGNEFTVASTSVREYTADVAMDSAGRFYVVYVKLSTSTNSNIFVARFSAAGVFLGTNSVATLAKNEFDPHITVSPQGSFVVSYTLNSGPMNNDVMAKVFTSAGDLSRTIVVANNPIFDESNSDVARRQGFPISSPFAVVYTINGKDVFLNRYDSLGNYLGTSAIAQTSLTETNPSIAANASENYVVAWQAEVGNQWNVCARTVFFNGAVSFAGLVMVSTNNETDPSIALKNNSNFVVGFHQDSSNTTRSVYATEMIFKGFAAPARRYVNLVAKTNPAYMFRTPDAPSVVIDLSGYYTIAYALFNGPGDPKYGVFSRLGQLDTGA